jgi:hypothetical protein
VNAWSSISRVAVTSRKPACWSSPIARSTDGMSPVRGGSTSS